MEILISTPLDENTCNINYVRLSNCVSTIPDCYVPNYKLDSLDICPATQLWGLNVPFGDKFTFPHMYFWEASTFVQWRQLFEIIQPFARGNSCMRSWHLDGC